MTRKPHWRQATPEAQLVNINFNLQVWFQLIENGGGVLLGEFLTNTKILFSDLNDLSCEMSRERGRDITEHVWDDGWDGVKTPK